MGSPDWQIMKKKLQQRGEHLLETGQWSDCSFVVGIDPHQQVLVGHKLFLAMSSPVFEAMFYGGMAETNDHPIPILDVQPDGFKALLMYIYTDKINLNSFEQACELCYVAKKYMLPYLVEECTKYIWSDLCPKNACRAYEFAKLFEEPILMEKCMQIICTQTQEVLSENSFEEVEPSTLLTVFEQEYLNIYSELDLFKAVSRYASRNASNSGVVVKKAKVDSDNEESSSSSPYPSEGDNNRDSAIRNILMKIRFLTLTAQQFAEGPALSDLLSKDEKFAILMNISSPLCNITMPAGFSTSKKARNIKTVKINSNFTCMSFSDSPTSLAVPDNDHVREQDNSNRPQIYEQTASIAIVPTVPPEDLVRIMPKIYCNRTLIQQTDCLNTSGLDCSVMFSVDRNICIIGVQVPAQTLCQPNVSALYSELLYAHLVDSDGSRLTYLHYTARVHYRSMIELTFNRPVYIQRNKPYTVGVVFHKAGWYPMGTCISRSSADNVTFTFGGGQINNSVREGLIRTIIFSYS